MAAATPTRLVLAAGLAAWIANAVAIWLGAAPLGHDEAQYAIAARDVLDGAPARWFYLSKGMSAVALPGVLAGGGELALRAVPLLFGVGFVLAAWAVARRAFGEVTAAWTVAVLAGARSYTKLSAELLSDMPAAACLLAATAVIAGELRAGPAGAGAGAGAAAGAGEAEDDRPRWRAVLAAPLLAAALYLRYASCVPIALLGAAWLIFGWRGIVRRPAPVAATAALFLLLCVPHAREAIALTGSPLGILLESGKAAPDPSTVGLVAYLAGNPFVNYGWLMPPILIAGLASVAFAPRRGRLLWLVAVAAIVVIAQVTQAQGRYIFFGTALLAMLGVDAIRRAIERSSPRPRRALAIGAAAAIAATWLLVLPGQLRHGARRAERTAATLLAAEAIRTDAAGRPCLFLGQHYTQLEWYSGCRTAEVVGYPPPGVRLYVVRDRTPGWQPELSGGPGRHATILERPGLVHVERVEPGP